MRSYFLFLIITIGFISTLSSQLINTEEINKRILRDSAVYSWERANEIVNGLESATRLDSVYNILLSELESVEQAYTISQRRVTRYKDSTVPLKDKIINERTLQRDTLKGIMVLNAERHKEQLKRKRRGNFWKGLFVGGGIVAAILALLGGG